MTEALEAAPGKAAGTRRLVARLDEKLAEGLGLDGQSFAVSRRAEALASRTAALGTDADSYLDRLGSKPGELAVLWRVLATYEEAPLSAEALRGIIDRLPERDGYRCWLAGLGRGHLASLLALELVARRVASPAHLTVFATDVDEVDVSAASRARLTEAELASLSPEARVHVMAQEDGGAVVSSAVRSRLAFAAHDVLRTPPFSRVDLLICQGLLHHLLPGPRGHLLDRLAFALTADGLLVVGEDYEIDADDERFVLEDPSVGLYRRVPTRGVRTFLPGLPDAAGRPAARQDKASRLAISALLGAGKASAWVVDVDGRIEHALHSEPSLSVPRIGWNPRDIRSHVDAALHPRLERALRKTARDRVAHTRTGLGTTRGLTVDLRVLPLDDPNLFLVELSERTRSSAEDDRVSRLEEELSRTRNELEDTVAALEVSNQQLEAANHELETANLQFADTNRELESQNQELRLRNDQLGRRNERLESLGARADELFEGGQVAAIFVGSDDRVVRVTHSVGRMIGFEPPVDEPLSPHALGGDLNAAIRAAIEEGRGAELERPIRGRHVLLRVVPYEASTPGGRCAVITLTDLSGVWRETAEAEARDRQLAALFEGADDPTLEVSPNGRIHYANHAACDLLGIPPEDGRTLVEVLEEREVPRAAEVGAAIEAARHGLMRPRVSLSMPDRGEVYDLAARPIYREGRVERVVVAARDMTELYQSQREVSASRALIQAVLDSLEASIAVVDESGGIVMHNRAWSASARRGFPGAAAGSGENLLEALKLEAESGIESSGMVHRYVVSALDGSSELGTCRFPVRHDRETLHLEMAATPLEHAGERLLVFTQVDVTSVKIAEQQRLDVQAKLLDADKLESLGVLAGGVAHDFNNLLVGILSNASFVVDQVEQGSLFEECLRDIERAAERAAELCQQLLAFSGRGRFQLQELSIDGLVQDCLRLLQSSVAKSVRLEVDLGEAWGARVEADPTQMRQVLFNLVSNAAEAIGDKGGRVKVSVATTELSIVDLERMSRSDDVRPGRFVSLRVSDDGSGISDEIKSRIFDPFFTTKFTGRGLGLAAVRGIVHGHGGAIDVTSKTGQGTVVTAYFPLRAEARSDVRSVILIVDDEYMVRAAASRALRRAGFEVLEAESGEIGLETFAEHAGRIGMLLLDVTMPGMSGEEVYLEVRKKSRSVPVLFSSGLPELSTAPFLRPEENAHFIQKPYRAISLVEKVREILGLGSERATA